MKKYTIFSVMLLILPSLVHANNALTTQERTAFSLLESIMDIVSAKIDASSCNEQRGRYQLTLFATGVGGERRQNNRVTANLPDQVITVFGYPKKLAQGYGALVYTGYANIPNYSNIATALTKYEASYTFNSTSELVTMTSNLELRPPYFAAQLLYSTEAITSLSRVNTSEMAGDYEPPLGWGISWLSNPEYPKSKYWQRFKFSQGNNINARTFFVRDLLAYRQSCRIKIDIGGYKGMDNISQEGYLTIDMSSPHDPVSDCSIKC